MRINLTVGSLLVFFLLMAPAGILAQEDGSSMPSEPMAKGTPAPSFILKDIHDVDLDLSEYLGKIPIVLSFWSIYCDSCVDEMISLQKLEEKYKGKDLLILAINEDIRVSSERIRRFLDRLERFRGKISYPLLFDQDSEVFTLYKGTYLPTLILIDGDGRIASYHRGFTPEKEPTLLASIESLVTGRVAGTEPSKPPVKAERARIVTVTGKTALCGFYDEGRWQKSFTGNDSFEQELELTRELARRDATRQTFLQSLSLLGIELYSHERFQGCIDELGIHLDRDPFDTEDPVSNLLNLISYSDYFTTLNEQEKLIDKWYYVDREVRISIDALADGLALLGYLFEPIRIEFTYVNMSRLDQKDFVNNLLEQSKFIGGLEEPVFTHQSTSQVLEVFTSSQGFADEILGMDFEKLKVFVEQVTPASLELEVWKEQ